MALHFGGFEKLGSGLGDLTASGWQGNADGAQGETGGRARSRAQQGALVILFDLGLGQRIEMGEDFGPRSRLAEVRNAVLQCLLRHEGEEAARHVTADRLVELVEDRARGELKRQTERRACSTNWNENAKVQNRID